MKKTNLKHSIIVFLMCCVAFPLITKAKLSNIIFFEAISLEAVLLGILYIGLCLESIFLRANDIKIHWSVKLALIFVMFFFCFAFFAHSLNFGYFDQPKFFPKFLKILIIWLQGIIPLSIAIFILAIPICNFLEKSVWASSAIAVMFYMSITKMPSFSFEKYFHPDTHASWYMNQSEAFLIFFTPMIHYLLREKIRRWTDLERLKTIFSTMFNKLHIVREKKE